MLADLRWGRGQLLGICSPLSVQFFHFHAVFGKFIEPPLSEKFWIVNIVVSDQISRK